VSEENVAIVSRYADELVFNVNLHQSDRRAFAERLRRGEVDAARAAFDLLDPNVVWTNPLGEVSEGRESCARYTGQLLEAWGDYALALRQCTDVDRERVLAEYEIDVRGATSGIAGRSAIFVVYTVRDGLIAQMDEFLDRSEALKAVGLEDG
jgi:ketosteroid isomerase-like protein